MKLPKHWQQVKWKRGKIQKVDIRPGVKDKESSYAIAFAAGGWHLLIGTRTGLHFAEDAIPHHLDAFKELLRGGASVEDLSELLVGKFLYYNPETIERKARQ